MASRKKKSPKQESPPTPKPPLQPYTWIRCVRSSLFGKAITEGKRYLFMGYITNAPEYGDNAVLWDDRGVLLTHLSEDGYEIA